MKLDGLSLLNDIADGYRSCLLVRSDEIPDKEIASLEMTPMFVDHDADVQRSMGLSALGCLERLKGILEALERRFPAELVNEIVIGLGDHESFTDRAAALRNDCSNSDGT
jgi:hypothetical protein